MIPPTETLPPADSSAPAPADDLISRHFDEPLPPEEHSKLEALLASNPQAVLDFVAMARLHQGLEAMGPPRVLAAKSPKMIWLRRAAVAGVAAALIPLVVWSIFSRPKDTGSQSRITVSDILPQPPADSPHPEAKVPAKRIVKAAGATALTPQPELEELLSRYYVNVSPQGLTVSQALAQLSQAVREVNFLNRPALNQLSFSVGKSIDPQQDDPVVRTPQSAPMTVKDYLENCGLYRQVTRQPGNVSYGGDPVALSEGNASSSLAHKVFQVSPDFITSHGKLNGEQFLTAKEVLSRFYGIELEDTGVAIFSAEDSKLTVSSTQDRLDLLQRRIGQNFPSVPVQIFVTTKLMTLPEDRLPIGFDRQTGMMLNDRDWQIYMRELSQMKGVNLFTAPSLISRTDQLSKVEIIRESALLRKDTEGRIIPGEYDFFNTGLTIPISLSFTGEVIRATGSVQYNLLAGMVTTELPGVGQEVLAGVPDDGVGHEYPTEFEIWPSDRETALFTLDVPLQEGRIAVAAITLTFVDPQGQRVEENFDSLPFPFGTPVYGKPGFVYSPYSYSQAGEVNVTGIPSGTKVRCPYTKRIFRVP